MSFTLDEFLSEHRPSRVVARICARQDLLDEHARLEHELAIATQGDLTENRDALAPGIATQITELEREIEAHTREFVFESIRRSEWLRLMGEHPPTEEVRKRGCDHDPETFPPVAIAACCVQPRMTVDQARRLADTISMGQWIRLWDACVAANLGVVDAGPKSALATAIHRVNAPSSITSANGESLAASS